MKGLIKDRKEETTLRLILFHTQKNYIIIIEQKICKAWNLLYVNKVIASKNLFELIIKPSNGFPRRSIMSIYLCTLLFLNLNTKH
jgi:hypothetical protein